MWVSPTACRIDETSQPRDATGNRVPSSVLKTTTIIYTDESKVLQRDQIIHPNKPPCKNKSCLRPLVNSKAGPSGAQEQPMIDYCPCSETRTMDGQYC